MSGVPIPLIDIHGVLVRELRADTGITALVEQRVFARKFPERMDFPAIKVTFPQTVPAIVPSNSWYTYIGDIDCYAVTHQEALELAQSVQRALAEIEGSDLPDASFQNVEQTGVDSGVDEEMSPQRPRWSVSVEITGRSR